MEKSFKRIVADYLEAEESALSDPELREAQALMGLPYQFKSESVALEVICRDDQTRLIVNRVRRWAERHAIAA